MPPLTRAQLNPTSPLIKGLILGIAANKRGTIARTMLKAIPVTAEAAEGKFWIAGTNNGVADKSLKRSPGAKMENIQVDGPSTGSYVTETVSAEAGPIAREIMDGAEYPEKVDRLFAGAIGQAFAIDEDKDVNVAMFSSASGWDTTTTIAALPGGAGVKWNAAGADILNDFGVMVDLFRDQADTEPLDCVIPYQVAKVMRRDTEIRKMASAMKTGDAMAGMRFNNTQLEKVLAEEFDLARVRVAGTRARTSNSGQTYASGEVFDDAIWMGILDGTGEQLGSQGLVVQESALTLIQVEDVEIETEYFKNRRSWFVYGNMRRKVQIMDSRLGLLAYDIL